MKTKTCRFLQMYLLIITAVFTLAGCNGRLFTYKGATITQANHIIRLQAGDQRGIWKTNELAIDYHYQMRPESLKISGTVKLVGGFALGFSSINRLNVQLLFLDNQGTVTDNVVIYSAEGHRPVDLTPMNFDETIPIPPDSKAISFTYDGELMDGGNDATFIDIWSFPS